MNVSRTACKNDFRLFALPAEFGLRLRYESIFSSLYRCDRIIGHFTVYRMVGCNLSGSSTIIVGVSCELLIDGQEGPWPMA